MQSLILIPKQETRMSLDEVLYGTFTYIGLIDQFLKLAETLFENGRVRYYQILFAYNEPTFFGVATLRYAANAQRVKAPDTVSPAIK